jgi:hypothetical protein
LSTGCLGPFQVQRLGRWVDRHVAAKKIPSMVAMSTEPAATAI